MTIPEVKRRNKNRLKYLLIIIISSFTVFATISMVMSYAICHFAFARSDQEQNLFLTYSDELSIKYPRRQVNFSSGQNTLSGHIYNSSNPRGVILMAHGMRSIGNAHLPEAMYFVDNGWTVFTFDGTGAGDSEGDNSVGLQQMVLDLLAAIDYLSTDDDTKELPLVLYGHSMGGYAAVIAAEEREKVKSVVSISGFDTPMDVMLNTGKRVVGDIAVIGYPFLYLQNFLIFGDLANRSATHAINNSDASFLIIYGTGDAVISESESIFGCKEEIKNPDTSFILVDEASRNEHSTAWLSHDAAKYRLDLEVELTALRDQYGQMIPPEIYTEFYKKIDEISLFELDLEFMDTILNFYNSSIE